jgi:hypothetical protein
VFPGTERIAPAAGIFTNDAINENMDYINKMRANWWSCADKVKKCPGQLVQDMYNKTHGLVQRPYKPNHKQE